MIDLVVRASALLALMLIAGCAPDGTENRQSPDNTPANASALAETIQPAAPAPVAAAVERSRYSSIEPSSCKLIEQNLEEGGYYRHRCPGLAGFALETSESDLRQDIVVIAPGGRRTQIELSSLVAKGAFNALGKSAEWRGDDPAKPRALIVRLAVAASPESDRPDISNLVVVRLAAPACVVGVVPPGPRQNEKARLIADGELGRCLTA